MHIGNDCKENVESERKLVMKFTYESYEMMLKKLLDRGYVFKNYSNWMEDEKTVILRHDVDYSLEKAAQMSEIEKKMHVEGTYFILLSTNFYNVHSKESKMYIGNIIKNGGNIGLHFDETQYTISSEENIKAYVHHEIEMLSNIIERKINVVSMHRPSKEFLSSNIKFENVINSYGDIFCREMKYVSDSRRFWRENIDEIIEGKIYKRLHILTHPYWYMEDKEKSLKQTLRENILNAALSYYDNMNDNFSNLEKEFGKEEIERVINSCVCAEIDKKENVEKR